MASLVRVVVDGDEGANGLSPGEPSEQLKTLAINGMDGEIAGVASRGSAAGSITMRLSQSNRLPGHMHAAVEEYQSSQHPPSSVDVPLGSDLFVSAVGGNGGNGGAGGDGLRGRDGVKGADATRGTDAQNGTDGGDGGRAGAGTDGASGGNGGDWSVAGGLGGAAGQHGKAGAGGKGGARGGEHHWKETIGYKYFCTTNCRGGLLDEGSSSSLVRVSTQLRTSSSVLMSAMRSQVVRGGNMQAIIAEAARIYGARTHQTIDPGSCKCHGGQGNCVGCGFKEIIKEFRRPPAFDGRDGQAGVAITDALLAGVSGNPGIFTIRVLLPDGQDTLYESPFALELVDYEVEDENGDGVFEPGEHVIIKRIRVRNAGGMPSPSTRIPVTIKASKWLVPDDSSAQVYLPSNIPAGEIATTEGECRARIRENESAVPSNAEFVDVTEVSLVAHMPWLERELPNFNRTKHIKIEYPLSLHDIECLSTLAQGSRSRIVWQLRNKSKLPIALTSARPRDVQVFVQFPLEYGSLPSDDMDGPDEARHQVYEVGARQSRKMEQPLNIAANAPNHSQTKVQISLFLSSPTLDVDGTDEDGVMLVHRLEKTVQISDMHVLNTDAAILLVTNCETSQRRLQAVRSFVQRELHLDCDQWNMSLYGGLKQTAEDEGKAVSSDILLQYKGKLIIFLGERFRFFAGSDKLLAADLCSPRAMAQLGAQGTVFLFLASQAEPRSIFDQLFQAICIQPPSPWTNIESQHGTSSSLPNIAAAVKSLGEDHLHANHSTQVLVIPRRQPWYYFGRVRMHAEARHMQRVLQKALPRQRCLIGVDLKQNATLASSVHISGSLDRLATVLAIFTNSEGTSLIDIEKYHLAAALPPSLRIGQLWGNPKASFGASDGKTEPRSLFAEDACRVSLLVDVTTEMSLLLSISGNTGRPRYIEQTQTPDGRDKFMRLHLPVLAAILRVAAASASESRAQPRSLTEFVGYALAATQPQTFGQSAMGLVVVSPLRRRVRKILMASVTELVSNKSDTEKEEFWSSVSQPRLSSEHGKDAVKSSKAQAAQLCKVSEHTLEHSSRSVEDFLRAGHLKMDVDQVVWDDHFAQVEDFELNVRGKEDNAKAVLEVSLLDETDGTIGESEVAEAHPVELEVGNNGLA